MSNPQYIVGIDLGTTHTVVAHIDLSASLDTAQPCLFEIAQLVAPGEVAAKPLLPSFRYHPTRGELAQQDLQLPWASPPLAGEIEQLVIGEWARELGSKVEGRLVGSAKSWLSHPQVDRGAAILPWAAVEEVPRVSPVLASASYLGHVRQAWNHEHPRHPLEQQEVIVTVPASFDEVARSLTVEAAAMAGLPDILLLEEPQAVCYDWFARNQQTAQERLQDIRLLLVCDVGGGTTDLSLIKVGVDGQGELALTRIGVGDHLMLGGDNVDLALARIAEQRIVEGGKKLNAASMSQLIQQTSRAKELLLSAEPPESARVTILGSGSRLLGGARSCELGRDEVRSLALDGFFPEIDFSERPAGRSSAVVEFGLPYASDPAVSKHIADFIASHDATCREALGELPPDQPAIPDAVLFNGGVFKSDTLSERALRVIGGWGDKQVVQLGNPHPDLAVAFGAVSYGTARRGARTRIGGGSARSYFLQLDTAADEKQAMCLLPKGAEEEQEIHLDSRKFSLRLGQPVQFHLLSSTGDTPFEVGEVCALDRERFLSLPPLVAVLDKVQGGGDEVEVSLVATLTPTGTLQLQCENLKDRQQRWNVEFAIRREMAQRRRQAGLAEPQQLSPRFVDAREKIADVFGARKKDVDPNAVKKLRADLEKLLGKREEWDTALARGLFDECLEGMKKRRRSMTHERVWFNLAGYALRPGFGHPLDAWRMEQIWPIYQQGLQFGKEIASWGDWWTFWRRAAGGLDEQQQLTIFGDIAKYLDPNSPEVRKLQAEAKRRSYEDMVRLAASLENLPLDTKTLLGDWLLERLRGSTATPNTWWALGRVASRVPFHGSAHKVIDRETVHGWLPRLMEVDWKKHPHTAFAAVMMSRMSGDRSRDLDDRDRAAVVDKLNSANTPAGWLTLVAEVRELDAAENKRIFGEALPSGLILID